MKKRRAQPTTSPPSALREPYLVPLSCPDCFGVLRFEREGRKGHLMYRCQVDHRYTPVSLVNAKEAQLERNLWSAVLLLKQMEYAYKDLSREMRNISGSERKQVQRRIREVRQQCLAIRAMIEGAHAIE